MTAQQTYAGQRAEQARSEASEYLRHAAALIYRRHLNLARPSIIVGAELSQVILPTSGQMAWQASYGGLFAIGSTPDEAFHNFDLAWEGVEDA